MPEAKMPTLMERLAGQTAAALAQGQHRHWVLLADGQRGIWRRAAARPVYRDFTQIDVYHAAEQLFDKRNPAAVAWYERWRHWLRHQPGGVTQLLRSLRYCRRRPRDRTRHHA